MTPKSTRHGRINALRRLSDEELATEASDGDELAGHVLLERFEDPVYRYSLALVRDPELAREVASGALLEARRALGAGEQREPIAPWLLGLAHASAGVAGDRDGHDQAAELAADADDGDRPRLEALLAGLAGLGELELSALLLRELAGLDYVGIATAAGSRPPTVRQATFRARLALQGDVKAPTEHCDEIRAAMSKTETGFRDRHSIAAHLEQCPVCDEFASQLEHRPEDLRTLFPTSPSSVVAGLPALPSAGVVATGAASHAGAASGGGRRRMAVPLALTALLIAAAVASALALQDSGRGKQGRASAADAGGTATQKHPASPNLASKPNPRRRAKTHSKARPAPRPKHAPKTKHAPNRKHSPKPAAARKAKPGRKARSAHGATPASPHHSARRRHSAAPRNTKRRPCRSGPVVSPAQTAYSSHAGAAQAQLARCGGRGARGGLASTGLELSLIVAAALMLLGLGLTLRRLSVPR